MMATDKLIAIITGTSRHLCVTIAMLYSIWFYGTTESVATQNTYSQLGHNIRCGRLENQVSTHTFYILLCFNVLETNRGANRQNTTHKQAFIDMSGGYNRFSK